MRIVGLDLSISATGVAEADGSLRTIKTKVRGPEMLDWMQTEILSITESVDLVAMEGYSFGSKGRSVFNIGELGGVIRLGFYRAGMPYVEIPPTNLKKYATGKGNSAKDEVLVQSVHRLEILPRDNNQADAAWLRAMALDHYGHPLCVMPKINRQALETVQWP